MSHLREKIQSECANVIIELAIVTPLLIILALGAVDFGNIMNSYIVLNHVTREAGSLASRTTGTVGSAQWANNLNSDIGAVITSASPVIKTTGNGPNQYKVYYSIIEWNPGLAACNTNVDSTLGPNCIGNLVGGLTDYYRIRKSNSGWAGNVTWQYGSLSSSSKLGANGDCACKTLPQVKGLSTQGLTLHSLEVSYDYGPSCLTPLNRFLNGIGVGVFYARSIFMGTA